MKQFQYTGWPEQGVPDSGSGLIDLIGQVQKWQRSSGDKPVVVHCSGGTGRTGTFIAVSVLLEKLKTEGVVDVFQTVRTLRLQRPGMVQTAVRTNLNLHACIISVKLKVYYYYPDRTCTCIHVSPTSSIS